MCNLQDLMLQKGFSLLTARKYNNDDDVNAPD